MLCPECGWEVNDGEACAVCERRRMRRTLCVTCGHEMDPGGDCEVCAVQQDEAGEELVERFCSGCGNVVHGHGDCPVCTSGRGARVKSELAMCPGCGNDVEDIHQCPICLDGRASGPAKAQEDDGTPKCPQCLESLEEQMWDGVAVLMCAGCQGCFFPPGGLEETLNKLRRTADHADLSMLAEEYRETRCLHLPDEVHYKACPDCGLSMTRRNYKRVSGIIIDVCGKHGTWVDQATFGQLTEFVTRGGDHLAARYDNT